MLTRLEREPIFILKSNLCGKYEQEAGALNRYILCKQFG